MADDQSTSGGPAESEVVVHADPAHLLEQKPSNTVFGIDKPLIDTARSASFVSDLTLQRYGIQTLDQLIEVSPSSYTASFYGVPGSLNIRGSGAENYFRGFKMIENLGTYSTPIADAADIEVVRGPPSPVYGAGKVGGMVNFNPESGKVNGQYISSVSGQLSAGGGSYGAYNFNGRVGVPLKLGSVIGGVNMYAEGSDTGEYYRGINPTHQLVEVSSDFDLGNGWSASFGGMAFHEDGNAQTPGWNRLTQDLIDNRTYITGQNTYLVDSNHDGRIEPGEARPGCSYPTSCSLHLTYKGAPLTSIPAWFPLTAGVGTTTLDRRTVYYEPGVDFSHTKVGVLYFDVDKDLGEFGSLKFQEFYNIQSNQRFVSYGFPSDFNAQTEETRFSYLFKPDFMGGLVKTNNIAGASNRYYVGIDKQSYGSGQISLNRRDLSVGATPTDTFDSPFNNSPGGLQWEINNHSNWDDFGFFETSDVTVADHLDVTVGGRYDLYRLNAVDSGIDSFETNQPRSGGTGMGTYSASISYKTDWGLMPYFTYDKATALEVQQAGDIKPSQIQSNTFLSDGDLTEAGVKFQLFNKTVVGAIDAYRQHRVQLAGINSIAQPTLGQGWEYEVRWLASKNFSFSLAGDFQHTEIIGPDSSTTYITPQTAGISPLDYGSEISVATDLLPGRGGNYDYSLIPHAVASVYGTYTSNPHSWGVWGATLGVTYAAPTFTLVQNPLEYPAYTITNLSGFIDHGPYEVAFNITNLFDTFYFTPDQSSYVNIGAVPGRGREWKVTVKRSF